MNEIFVKLANMSVAAGWLILVVLVLRLALKKAPRWITCLLWAAVAVRLVCPISFQSPVSAYQVAAPAAVQPSGQVEYFQYVHAGGDKPSIQLEVDAIRPAEAAGSPAAAASGAEEPNHSTVTRYLPPYVAIWLAVGAALLLYGLGSTLRLRYRVREAVRLRDNVWECDAVTAPFLLGLFRPRVYLPSGMEEGQMRYVLAHEQAHLRRLDHVWKPLAYVLLAVHWFNPLVWVAYLLFCRDIETACDQRVIRDLDMAEKKAYSTALLQCSQGRRMVLACPVAFGEEGVRGRIKAVLHYKKPAFWVILMALIACVVVAVCFLTDPVSGGKKGTLTFVEKENIVSTWRADFTVDNRDASLSGVLYADVWKDGQRESTRLLTMTRNINELSIQVTQPERNEQMLPMFSLWAITDAYGGYGDMSDHLKEMPKDVAFAAYRDGEQRQVAAGDTVVLAAVAADFGGGLPEFDCRKLEKQPDIAKNADYMIVIQAFFALSETAPTEDDDGLGVELGLDTDSVHEYLLPAFRLPVEVDITGVAEMDSGVDLATLINDRRWAMRPTDDQPAGAEQAITLHSYYGGTLYIESGVDHMLWVNPDGTASTFSGGMTGDEMLEALSAWAWQMKRGIARSKEAVPDAETFFERFPGGGFRWDVYLYNGNDSADLVGRLYDYAADNTLTADQCRTLLRNTTGLDGAYAEGYAAALAEAYQKDQAAYLQAWQSLTTEEQRAVPADPDGILPRPTGAAVSTTGGAAFPLSEKAVTTALNDVGLPVAISSEETQSYMEGHVVYTLRSGGEDIYPFGVVNSAVYDGGKRHLTVMYMTRPEGNASFRWKDWQQAITLAGMLWGGFDDDEQMYRQLSDLNIPDDSVTGASWETETDGGFCSIGYTVTMIQGKPSHVGLTISFYDSQQEYRQQMKEVMQNTEARRLEQNQLLEQTGGN